MASATRLIVFKRSPSVSQKATSSNRALSRKHAKPWMSRGVLTPAAPIRVIFMIGLLPPGRVSCPPWSLSFKSDSSKSLHELPQPIRRGNRRGSSSARGSQRSAYVSGAQAVFQSPPRQIAVQESAVEGISRACGIDGTDSNRFLTQEAAFVNGYATVLAQLDNGPRYPLRQLPHRFFLTLFSGHRSSFRFGGKDKIELVKQFRQSGRLENFQIPPDIRRGFNSLLPDPAD